jgi:hypothetical protein
MILGKRWKIEYRNFQDPDQLGLCDPKSRTISIRKGATEFQTLVAVIHESLHAGWWYLDEEWVQLMAEDIALILWKQGWRNESCRETAPKTRKRTRSRES